MQIRVRNMNKILNEILIINYSIIFYPFVYSAKNYSPYNWIIYFEFLYNIYFIYYIYNVSKFLYDTFFKFFAIIIKSKARIILLVSTNVILKYTFLNSFNHNVPSKFHYFTITSLRIRKIIIFASTSQTLWNR